MTKAPPGVALATWFPGLDETYARLLDAAQQIDAELATRMAVGARAVR